MAALFLSTLPAMFARWRAAFPDALIESLPEQGDEIDVSSVSSLWVDLTTVAPQARSDRVEQLARMGKPLIAMVPQPDEAESFALLQAGAQGYCHTHGAVEQLREIALVVEHGGLWMPPPLMQRFLALSTRVSPNATPLPAAVAALTERERMVADEVARGASNREIAQKLAISERTVKSHLTTIFDKLQVRDRVQLALMMNNIPT